MKNNCPKKKFDDLPKEVKREIAKHLNSQSLANFSLLNRSAFTAANSDIVKISVMKKMSPKRLYETCFNYPNIAQLALSDQMLAQKLSDYITSYDTNDLGELIRSNAIANLCYEHHSIAAVVMNNPYLIKILHDNKTEDLINIAEKHKNIALNILKNLPLVEQISSYSLVNIGARNLEAAKYIFRTPVLLNSISAEQIYIVLTGVDENGKLLQEYNNELLEIIYNTLNNMTLCNQLKPQIIQSLNYFIRNYVQKANNNPNL